MKITSRSLAQSFAFLFALTCLTGCKPQQDENYFNEYAVQSETSSEGKSKTERPEDPREVDPNDGGEEPTGPEEPRPEYGMCDLNLSVTSSNKSQIKIVVGNREVLQKAMIKLNQDEIDFINSAIDGKEPLKSGPYREQGDEETEGVVAAMSEVGLYKETSSHGKRYLFYGEDGMAFDTTSSKSDRVVIYANKKISVDTTSYDVKESVLLLETYDLDIDVCLKNTSAGSIDLLVDAPGSNVRVVSKGTSFKNQVVTSEVLSASKAKQIWSGTSFQGSTLSIIGEADYNETSLKFTSIRAGHAKIMHKGEDGQVILEGTSVKNDPSAYITVENQAESGTRLLANVIHTDKGGYRGFERILLDKGETEIID